MAPTQVFSSECCDFFKNSFFYRTPPIAAFMSTRKRRRGKRRKKARGKIFQMTEENENISSNFYLQILVLVKTEMQIQLCKYYRTAHPFFSYFFWKFSFLWFLDVHFLCFHCRQTEKYLLLHLLVYSEADIGGLFRKTAVRQDTTKFYKIGVSFHYSLLNKKV